MFLAVKRVPRIMSSLQPTKTKSYFRVLLLVLLVVDNTREVLDMKDYFAKFALRTAGVSSMFTYSLALR